MRLAIVTDWLTTSGGAERAIAEFHALWPDSPIYATVARPHAIRELEGAEIRTSWLQKIYAIVGHHQVLLPLMPIAIESIDLSGFDVILSSSHAVGKGVIAPQSAVHVCYCHTPMRYAWEMERQYVNDSGLPNFLKKKVRQQLRKLRKWDLTTARRVDVFIANSSETAERIQRIYGRTAVIVPPPVQQRFFDVPFVTREDRKGFLCVGRLVPYKRFDLAIEAANMLKVPLTIVGKGQEIERLKSIAGPTVIFRGRVEDNELPGLYASASAVLFPTYEDAGLVPMEAQACGTPVIALGKGGALDTVLDGKTGMFFEEQTASSLAQTMRAIGQTTWDAQEIRKNAEKFSAASFRKRLQEIVNDAMTKFGSAARSA